MANSSEKVASDRAAQRRQAKRASVDHPVAKVVCQAGEYLCAVRDVSNLGVGLTFLHAVPPEPRILLQLANDLTYPIERVWIGKRQAGYRFASHVAIDEFASAQGPHDTRPIRLNIAADAVIADGNRIANIRLLNLSCDGARFESDADLARERLLGFSAPGLQQRLGQVRWRDGQQFGMRFQHPLTHHELAQGALRMQPLGTAYPDALGNALAKARAA